LQRGRKLIEFCELKNFEILNGKFGLDIRGEFTFINKQGNSVIDYTLASEGILRHILDFKIGVEVISTHMPLLIELDNIVQDRNNEINRVSHTRSQDLIRYKWNDKYKNVFYKRLDDSVGNIFRCQIQDIITKGKVEEAVNVFYGMIKGAGSEMVTKTRWFIEGDYWYDKQCKRKKREVKLALNEYKKQSDGESRSKYCNCRREYVSKSFG
jgi:hypothetical protein